MGIKWDVSPAEYDLLKAIARRFQSIDGSLPAYIVWMDVTAVHVNGCPLQLEALLEAPEPDFIRDVHGIFHYINRETGQLEGFVPKARAPIH